jgi:hypothetical protein
MADVQSQHTGGAGGGPQQAEEHLDQRAFPGTVGPEQSGDAFAQTERDLVQNLEGPEVLGEGFQPDHLGLLKHTRLPRFLYVLVAHARARMIAPTRQTHRRRFRVQNIRIRLPATIDSRQPPARRECRVETKTIFAGQDKSFPRSGGTGSMFPAAGCRRSSRRVVAR